MDQNRRLDLDRYRRMKERGRFSSPRMATSSICDSSQEVHHLDNGSPPYPQAPRSPEPSNLSRSMVCGILGGSGSGRPPSQQDPQQQQHQTSQSQQHQQLPLSLHEQTRQRKTLDKYRPISRPRDRYAAGSTNSDSLETSTTLISPNFAPSPPTYPRSSRVNIFKSRPSPLTRLQKNKRMPVDPPNDAIAGQKIRESPSAGTIHEPIQLEDTDEEGMIPADPTSADMGTSYYNNNNNFTAIEVADQPEELKLSTSSTKKDRIEESRDQSDYRYESPQMNRDTNNENVRDALTEVNSLQQHSSLEMPSLHSQFSSMEPYQIDLQNNGVSATMPPQEGHKVQFADQQPHHDDPNLAESNHAEDYRRGLEDGLKLLATNEPYRRPEKQVQQIYRPESPSVTIPVLDQKTVRFLYSKDFQELIAKQKEDSVDEQNENVHPMGLPSSRRVTFVARKRSISEEEVSIGDFDVVNAATSNSNNVVVFEATLMPDYTTKLLTPHSFQCDGVFSDQHTSEEFYIRAGQSLVLTAKDGGSSAFIIFGCLGSGTSDTLTDIEERAAYDIFGSNDPVTGMTSSVSVQYVELIGKQCFDLIGPVGNFCRIVESEGGSYQIKGAVTKTASNENEMLTILSDAKRRLATQTSISIRKKTGHTFVVCKLTIRQGGRCGCLTIVECSTQHERLHDNSDAPPPSDQFDQLMECVESKAAGKFGSNISELSSNVAKILKETLHGSSSRVCVVATVSPCASATESSISTLSTLSKLSSLSPDEVPSKRCLSPSNEMNENEDHTLPRQWSHAELVNWMGKKNLLSNPVPPDINGRFAMRMSKMQLKNTFYDVVDEAKAERLYKALRAENDRIARIRVKLRIARDLDLGKN